MTNEPVDPWTPSYAHEVEQAYHTLRPKVLDVVRGRAAQLGIPDSRLDAEGVVQETFAQALHDWLTIEDREPWL